MIDVHHKGSLLSVWFLHSLSPVKNLYVHTIVFQLPLGSNTISSQFNTCNEKGWMACSSGRTTCSSTVRPVSVYWYIWGGGKYAGDVRFWIKSDIWRVSCCFGSLYMSAILRNMIQASLGSLCEALLLIKLDTFTNPIWVFNSLVFMLILLFIHPLNYYL